MARCCGSGRWVWSCVLAGGLCVGPVAAQDSGEQSAPRTEEVFALEEVIVTGSRIARRDFTAPSPISTLDREDILSSAQPTLEEALNRMPQVTPDFGRTSNNPGNGTSRINLRGLGANRTLVMLNGRRLAPAGVGSEVDVNTIPQALVERVEIVTGGATTVYGSDAVSGVVNFITRRNFEGLEVAASAYVTAEGDSEVYDGNIAWGRNLAGGEGNISVFAGYLERHASFAGDRAISSVPLTTNWMGEINAGGNANIPAGRISLPQADLGDGPVTVTFTPDGVPIAFQSPEDLYNYQPINYLQVPLERVYGGFFLDYPLFAQAEIYAEVILTRNEAATNTAPVPATFRPLRVNLDNPLLTPDARQVFTEFYAVPDSNLAAFQFQRRLEELGPRITDYDSDYNRLVAGLRGEFGETWAYDLWLSYTDSDEKQSWFNDASSSRFLQGLLVDPLTGQCFDITGGCVPVDPFGAGSLSDEALAYIRFDPYTNLTTRKQQLASGYLRGTPFDSWAGPVSLAFGLEWREDSGDFEADQALFTGDSLGYPGTSSVDGEERVREAFGEALVPLIDGADWPGRLELELGGRLSHYEHSGSTDTYKFGLGWEPREDLRLRTMFQRSVRAPNLVEAFQQQRIGNGYFVTDQTTDPCSASRNPVGAGFAGRCIGQGIPEDQIGVFEATPFYPMDIIEGGNPEVQPETGETWTVGLVYLGLEGWQISVDYFDLRIDDTIGVALARFVCFDPDNTEAALCDKIVRDPLNYNVIEVDLRTSNLGNMHTDGYDFQASYMAELPAALALVGGTADLWLDLVWTHLNTLSFQTNPAVESIDCAGTFGEPCTSDNVGVTSPSNRVTVFGRYASGDLEVALAWRWLEGTRNNAPLLAANEGEEDPIIAIPSIPSKNYFDLGVGYRFGERTSARLDVANLLDTQPPLMADAVFSNNTDDRMYDIFGRAYRLSMNFRY